MSKKINIEKDAEYFRDLVFDLFDKFLSKFGKKDMVKAQEVLIPVVLHAILADNFCHFYNTDDESIDDYLKMIKEMVLETKKMNEQNNIHAHA